MNVTHKYSYDMIYIYIYIQYKYLHTYRNLFIQTASWARPLAGEPARYCAGLGQEGGYFESTDGYPRDGCVKQKELDPKGKDVLWMLKIFWIFRSIFSH